MEIENENINLPRVAIIGVVSVFPGLRRTIGVIALLMLIWAGLLFNAARHPAPLVVNLVPMCNRVVWQTQMIALPPPQWGDYTKSIGADHPTFYVHESRGNGWCMVKKDQERVNGLYRWYEVPTKYGERVQQLAKPPEDPRYFGAAILAFLSVGLLGIWLPATIMAAVGRRLLRNVKEEY